MTIPDYLIITAVAILFVLAFASYKKKPRCTCKNAGECSGNCIFCSTGRKNDNEKNRQRVFPKLKEN